MNNSKGDKAMPHAVHDSMDEEDERLILDLNVPFLTRSRPTSARVNGAATSRVNYQTPRKGRTRPASARSAQSQFEPMIDPLVLDSMLNKHVR